jgi:nucleoid-associated protein YgaU
MGKDYRIGLLAGFVLAGGALAWVATRPGLGPRLPWLPGSGQNSVGAGRLVSLPPANSTPEADKSPEPQAQNGGRKTDNKPTRQSVVQSSPAPAAPGTAGPAQVPRIHVVRPGETLSTIAQQYYGTTNGWRKVLAANERTIKDANKIPVGTKLVIP